MIGDAGENIDYNMIDEYDLLLLTNQLLFLDPVWGQLQ